MQIRMKSFFMYMLMMVCVLALSACVTTSKPDNRLAQKMAAIEDQEKDLAQQKKALEAEKKQLAQRNVTFSSQESQLLQKQKMLTQKEQQLAMAPKQEQEMETTDLFPPNAKPGECYARIFIPNKYKYETKKIIVHDPKETIQIIPARYETVKETVLVKEASTRLVVEPAQYQWIEETKIVSPAKTELVQVAAVYETVTEKVLVRPAHNEWKKGTGPVQKVNETTGEIMCLVTEPAVYKTISKRKLKTPVTTREVMQPAVRKTIRKRIMVSAPVTTEIAIPAEYGKVNVTRMVSPATSKKIITPAVYDTVKQRVIAEAGHMEWTQILCETNMTQVKISQIQQALVKAGYDPGPIDGVIGTETMSAVNEFQASNKLPITKYLTFETLQALNVRM